MENRIPLWRLGNGIDEAFGVMELSIEHGGIIIADFVLLESHFRVISQVAFVYST